MFDSGDDSTSLPLLRETEYGLLRYIFAFSGSTSVWTCSLSFSRRAYAFGTAVAGEELLEEEAEEELSSELEL